MALSATFTQCAPETTKFGKITPNKGHFAVQGHSRSWYQSKAHIRLPISDYYYLTCYLAQFARYSLRNVKNRYTWLPLLHLNPLTEGFP